MPKTWLKIGAVALTAASLGGAPAQAQQPSDAGVAAGSGTTAQDAAPTLGVTLGRTVSLAGAEALSAGTVRIEFQNPRRASYRYGIVYALRPGRTAATAKRGLQTSRSAFFSQVARLESSIGVYAGQRRALHVTLAPSTTFVAVDASARRMRDWKLTAFRTGGVFGTAAQPTAAATMSFGDRAVTAPATLPRSGVVRFDNPGKVLHSATAYRLRAGATRARVAARLRSGDFTAFRRLTSGRPTELSGLVSPAKSVAAELAFPAAGRYVVLCAEGLSERRPHFRRGEFALVTVQ